MEHLVVDHSPPPPGAEGDLARQDGTFERLDNVRQIVLAAELITQRNRPTSINRSPNPYVKLERHEDASHSKG